MAEEKFSELGSAGLKRFGGILDEEFLRELKGRKGRETYRQMSQNDAVIGAILFCIEMLIRSAEWRVVPADASTQAADIALFIEECMHDMTHTWDDFISEVLSMLVYGFSFFEVVYKRRRDGRIGWGKLASRAQETIEEWKFGENGEILAAVQSAPPTYRRVELPLDKGLLFRTTVHKGNPEGVSVLRRAYRSWYFAHKIEMFEAIGVERDLAGIPVAKIPSDIINQGGTAYSNWKNLVVNLRRDEQQGVVIPSDVDEDTRAPLYDLTLMSSAGTRQLDTGKIIQRHDQRKAMVVLADFILLGHENVGSFALSDNKTNAFLMALRAWLETIGQTITRHEIPRLMELNGLNVDLQPSIEGTITQPPDLKTLGQFVKDVTGAGLPLFPDDATENALRTAAGLPEKEP